MTLAVKVLKGVWGKFFQKFAPRKKEWNNTYMTRVRFRYWKD